MTNPLFTEVAEVADASEAMAEDVPTAPMTPPASTPTSEIGVAGPAPLTAEAAAPPPGAGAGQLLVMMAIFFGLMYFLIIRPQSKRAKEHKQLLDGLKKGDEIVTNGGLAGSLTHVGESFIRIEVAEGVENIIQKQAVAMVLPKGSLKNV